MAERKNKDAQSKEKKSPQKVTATAPTVSAGADTAKASEPVTVVGVGASAGGLEALRSFVAALPKGARMTYIIAQHLSPTHPSMLTQLLSRETELSVKEARADALLELNTIHVTPANSNVRVVDGRIRLAPPDAGVSPKPSVDILFQSLAEEVGEHACGVILSGTGSDGARGIQAIKAAGGCSYAQDDKTAKYDGMPSAAVATGCVDYVLPPERIAEQLGKLAELERAVVQVPAQDAKPIVEQIMHMLQLRTGTDFSRYKENTVQRRLQRRMIANQATSYEQYADVLRNHPGEAEKAAQEILISVTSFFRDRESFERLGKIIDDILRQKQPGDEIRIWVPGCATGEEAYSIALMLYERLGSTVINYRVQIFATDIDIKALAKARKASFHSSLVAGLSETLLNKYFSVYGESYVLNKTVRDLVVIARQDITEDPPFLRLDLVSCRNLLIYFKAPLQNRVIEIFHYALREGGYLFLGNSESSAQRAELFKQIDSKAKIYQRISSVARIRPVFAGRFLSAPLEEAATKSAVSQKLTAAERLQTALVEAYGPPTVLVDARMQILQVHGDVHPYLQIPQGDLDWDLIKLLRKELKTDLRGLAAKAKRDKALTVSRTLPLPGINKPVRISVRWLQGRALEEDLYLISFEPEQKRLPEKPGEAVHQDEVETKIAELEDELTATREHLQTVIEELETSNEELQSLNEELQSANEELQSTNEELETANEELQSTNEELTTVNDELQLKSAELQTVNTDLHNVKDSLAFPLIVVDKDLRVTLHNPVAEQIFRFAGPEIHPHITTLPSTMDLPKLRERITEVIETGKSFEQQLDGDHAYVFRIAPYVQTNFSRVSGAVLTFVENTQVMRAQRQLRESQAMLFAVIARSPLFTYVRDLEGRYIFTSEEFTRRLGLPTGSAVGKFDREILPEDICRVFTRYDLEAMHQDAPLETEDTLTLNGQRVTLLATRFAITADNGRVLGIVMKAQDITDRKANERQLLLQSKALQESINGIVIADARRPNELPIVYVNPAFEALTGYSSDEVLGLNCRFLQGTDTAQAGIEVLRQAIRTSSPGRTLLRNYRKDGSMFWNEVAVYPVRDDRGRLMQFVGTQMDVTARIESEKALKDSRQRLRTAQEFARVGDFEWTLDDHLLCSDSVRQLLHLPAQTSITLKVFTRRVHGSDAARVEEALTRCRSGHDDVLDIEFRVVWNKTERWVHVKAHMVEASDAKPAALVGLALDITERKSAEARLIETIEQLERTNQDLEQFVYIASHDLQEPLRKLTSFSDLLERRIPNADANAKEMIDRIRQAASRMQHFIKDLLSFSHVTADKGGFAAVDLNAVVRDAIADLDGRIDDAEAHVDVARLPTIEANATQMSQLFCNLISNSIKYSRADVPPVIKIDASRIGDPHAGPQWWEIRIEDNGIGFEDSYAEQIFGIFKRLHGKGEYEGTGVGLAICRKVVERHGGEIFAKGVPGRGATFTIRLPAAHAS